MFDLAARLGVRLSLLDIGGGFPGWDGSECVYQQQQTAADGGTVEGSTAGGGIGVSDGLVASTAITAAAAAATAVPLSLAEIAGVTLPVLGDLFPASSGVRVRNGGGRTVCVVCCIARWRS